MINFNFFSLNEYIGPHTIFDLSVINSHPILRVASCENSGSVAKRAVVKTTVAVSYLNPILV